MASIRLKFARFGLLLVGSATLAAGAVAQVAREDPGVALNRHMQALGQDPRNAYALIGAGHAALDLGDPSAAATFFARAEEVSPRDGRVKAGLGSAMVALEQAHGALKLFNEATALGIPEAAIAKDRGLAHDMIGDTRSAQRDYQLALRQREDDETRRRLALSLAIGGDRAGALAAIDAQLRRQDRAAWRTRAFVLALTGNAAEATTAASSVMHGGQAEALRPFFARLPQLNPAQRALAVHFGHFPADGRSVQMAQNFAAPTPAPATTAPASTRQPSRTTDARRTREAESTASRRRPGTASDRGRANRLTERVDRVGSRIPFPRAEQEPVRVARAEPAPNTARVVDRPQRQAMVAASTPAPAARSPIPTPSPVQTPSPAQTVSRSIGSAPSAATGTAPPPSPPPAASSRIETTELAPSAAATVKAQPDPAPATPEPRPEPVRVAVPGFASIASLVAGLSDPEAPPPAAVPAPRDTTPAKPTSVATPGRHWVQVAGGADKALLPVEYGRLRQKAPELFKGKSAWTTPLRYTNRLLVGPFETEAEAQGFVNALAAAEVAGFSWTSPPGQEIEKLAVQ